MTRENNSSKYDLTEKIWIWCLIVLGFIVVGGLLLTTVTHLLTCDVSMKINGVVNGAVNGDIPIVMNATGLWVINSAEGGLSGGAELHYHGLCANVGMLLRK